MRFEHSNTCVTFGRYPMAGPNDLDDESILIEVMGSRKGQNEFLGQALVPIREGLDHSTKTGPIELRLLPLGHCTPWDPTSTKTNVQGSNISHTSEAHRAGSSDSRLTHSSSRSSNSTSPRTAPEVNGGTTANFASNVSNGVGPTHVPPPVGSNDGSRQASGLLSTSTTSIEVANQSGLDTDTEDGHPSHILRPVSAPSHESNTPSKLLRPLTSLGNSNSTTLLSPLSNLSSMSHAPTLKSGSAIQTSVSTLEMALNRPEASLVTGQSYALNCEIEACYDLPISSDAKDRFYTISAIVEGHKDKTNNIDCALCDENGALPMNNETSEDWHTSLLVPFKLSSHRHMPNIQLRLSHVRPHFKQEVGRATVALSTIPIYQSDDQAQSLSKKQMPADLYLHKPRIKRLPPGLKPRNDAHVCHLRVKLWLTELEQVIMEDSGDLEAELFDEGEIADIDDEIGDIPSDLPEALEWTLIDEVVAASLHRLNSLLFDEDSAFMQVMSRMRFRLLRVRSTFWSQLKQKCILNHTSLYISL